MPRSFTSQIDQVTHAQAEWLPRSQDANGGGEQGARLVALTYGAPFLYNNLAIRDTNPHPSDAPGTFDKNPQGIAYDQVYAPYKSALLTSTLNQIVTVQPLMSFDGVTWYDLGSTQTIAAYGGTGPAIPLALYLSTAAQYLPYVAVTVSCATAPTSGVLSGILARLG